MNMCVCVHLHNHKSWLVAFFYPFFSQDFYLFRNIELVVVFLILVVVVFTSIVVECCKPFSLSLSLLPEYLECVWPNNCFPPLCWYVNFHRESFVASSFIVCFLTHIWILLLLFTSLFLPVLFVSVMPTSATLNAFFVFQFKHFAFKVVTKKRF